MAAKKGNPVLTKVFTIEKQNVDLQCFRAADDKYNTYLVASLAVKRETSEMYCQL